MPGPMGLGGASVSPVPPDRDAISLKNLEDLGSMAEEAIRDGLVLGALMREKAIGSIQAMASGSAFMKERGVIGDTIQSIDDIRRLGLTETINNMNIEPKKGFDAEISFIRSILFVADWGNKMQLSLLEGWKSWVLYNRQIRSQDETHIRDKYPEILSQLKAATLHRACKSAVEACEPMSDMALMDHRVNIDFIRPQLDCLKRHDEVLRKISGQTLDGLRGMGTE